MKITVSKKLIGVATRYGRYAKYRREVLSDTEDRIRWLSENTGWYYLIPSRIDYWNSCYFRHTAYIHDDDAIMFKLSFGS